MSEEEQTDLSDIKSHANKFNLDGHEKLDDNDLESALECYTTAINLDPENSAYLFNRGITNLAINYIDKALIDLSKAIDLDSSFNSDFHLFLGITECRLNKYSNAIRNFNRAIHLDDKYPLYYLFRGYALWELSENKEAVIEFLTHDLFKSKGEGYRRRINEDTYWWNRNQNRELGLENLQSYFRKSFKNKKKIQNLKDDEIRRREIEQYEFELEFEEQRAYLEQQEKNKKDIELEKEEKLKKSLEQEKQLRKISSDEVNLIKKLKKEIKKEIKGEITELRDQYENIKEEILSDVEYSLNEFRTEIDENDYGKPF